MNGDVAAVVWRGVRQFNRGRYVASHEIWEAAWQTADADVRPFLEALVQLATALHLRTRRGATRGAEHLLAQALVTLEDCRPAAHGVDVERAVREFDAFLEWVRAVGRPHRVRDAWRVPRLRAAPRPG